jgi:hypothetical protein
MELLRLSNCGQNCADSGGFSKDGITILGHFRKKMFGIPSEGFQNKKSNIFVDDKDTND